MFVYLSTDHAGFELKNQIAEFLKGDYKNFEIKDFGAFKYDENDDYPDFIIPCIDDFTKDLEKNKANNNSFAIVIGGSGTGEAITANRFKGVRAVVANSDNLEIIKLGRMHNDANVISFGARFVDFDFAKQAIKIFLETKFEGGRHQERINKIDSNL